MFAPQNYGTTKRFLFSELTSSIVFRISLIKKMYNNLEVSREIITNNRNWTLTFNVMYRVPLLTYRLNDFRRPTILLQRYNCNQNFLGF